ncbi:hypothetical protein ACH5RR_010891 [Cinchona calisaya]|uniref:ABC transmembrane type-1 domain-containing protein n=1 Tax=Cinchona calisaya TaxID=153742 RepID=A0ABD3AK61_9GENT
MYQQWPLVEKEYAQEKLSQLVNESTSLSFDPTVQCGKGRPSLSRQKKALISTTQDPSQFEIVEASLRHKTQQGGSDYAQASQTEGIILVVDQESMLCDESKFIQLMSTFIGSFVITFVKGWLLTLVMLSSIPPLVMAGGVMALFISRMASLGQDAYAKAATVVEQTVGSIRTVASIIGKKQVVANNNKSLENAYESGVYEGMATGLGLGSVV